MQHKTPRKSSDEPHRGTRHSRIGCIKRAVFYAIALLAGAWCLFATFFLTPGEVWQKSIAVLAAASWFIVLRRLGSPLRIWIALLATILVLALTERSVRPSDRGDWSRLHDRHVQVEFEDLAVRVRNLRQTDWVTDSDYQVAYYDRRFDLTSVESVWFGVQQFISWRGGSHTFVSFGFSDGTYLAVSVEARRGEGEGFNPLAGMFKQCGLIYVIGDEWEVIGPRVSENEYPVYLYPIRATPEQAQEMFQVVLRRADGLRANPEFYHTTLNNCTTNIVESFNTIAPRPISPHSLSVKFPGYSGAVAYEQGLINSDMPFEAVQEMARINERANGATREDFSQRIRAGFDLPSK